MENGKFYVHVGPSGNTAEKVSVNVNISTLSSIDLLVDNGYYSNRSDFVNQALRSQLQQHQSTLDRIIAQQSAQAGDGEVYRNWFFGVSGISVPAVEEMLRSGRRHAYSGYGLLAIDDDVPAEKLFAAVESIRVKGKVLCRPEIKAHSGLK